MYVRVHVKNRIPVFLANSFFFSIFWFFLLIKVGQKKLNFLTYLNSINLLRFVYMVVFDVEAVLKNAKLPIIERLKFFLNLKFRIFSISCQQWWEQMKKLR